MTFLRRPIVADGAVGPRSVLFNNLTRGSEGHTQRSWEGGRGEPAETAACRRWPHGKVTVTSTPDPAWHNVAHLSG